jgi:hypothetical protein
MHRLWLSPEQKSSAAPSNSAAVANPCSVQDGGTVIFMQAGGFQQLGLPWDFEAYYRADFFPGPAAEELGFEQGSIYNVKASLIGNVEAAYVVFGPGEGSYTQSLVWAPKHVGHQPGVAAAAFAATQGGHVGYVGDVNGEPLTAVVVLAMLQHSAA